MLSRFRLFFVLAVLTVVLVAACNSGGSSGTPMGPGQNPPVINSFTVDKSTINSGDYATLSWTTTNATSCAIDNGVGTVPASGSEMVDPTTTTTYTLTASNSTGNAVKTCQVTVQSANMVLTSSQKTMTSYHCPEILGTITNTGSGPGYNVEITFKAYNSSNVIIDTANGFPADLATIATGESANFDAVFFKLNKWSQVSKTTYEISWLNGMSYAAQRVRVEGVIY